MIKKQKGKMLKLRKYEEFIGFHLIPEMINVERQKINGQL